jgi:hypothetical protein
MKRLAVYLLVLVIALPALAQTPEPTPAPPPPPPPQPKQKSWFVSHLFVGGGVGASFGDVDYVEVAPMVGLHVIPRFDVGVQPFYQWTEYSSPSIETTDYGARLFARVRIWGGLFAEADYEYTNYEYPNVPGTNSTTRGSYDAFLVGGGYFFGFGGRVGMYASALYDLSYDGDDPFRPYDSAIRYAVGVSVGF